jgi:hypothetical protein
LRAERDRRTDVDAGFAAGAAARAGVLVEYDFK